MFKKLIFKKTTLFFKPAFESNKRLYLNKHHLYLLLNSFNKKNYKILRNKTKRVCTFVFKREDFFLITNIYINNKLVFVSTFEQHSKQVKFFKFLKAYFFKVIKLWLSKVSKFDRVLFIVKFTKPVLRVRRKINRFKKKSNGKVKIKSKRTRTHVFLNLIRKLVVISIFFGKNIKMKYVFNRSHSHVREKLKKKRRK